MNENLKKFLEEVEKNEELKAKLKALTDKDTAVEKAIEIAKEYGFTLTAEDCAQKADGELSEDELASVAGGVMGCFIISGDRDGGGCGCVVVGAVKSCGCAIAGSN